MSALGEGDWGALAAIGIEDTETAIKNKASRGHSTFVFFFQAMVAIGVDGLRIPEGDSIRDPATGAGSARLLAQGGPPSNVWRR